MPQWYSSRITLPHYQAWKDSEKVCGFVGTEMGMRYHEVLTSHLMRPLDLQPFNTRLVVADWVSLHERVSGDIDCSALLAKVNLRIPGPTRSTDLLVHTSNQLPTVWTWLEYKDWALPWRLKVDLSLTTYGLLIPKSSFTSLPTCFLTPMCSNPPSNVHT